ncbi:acyltransferase [Microbispora rosea]|uniref:acyltransferase family protein n=1 Tax=Microbispora rosea TaxID=58117 RepID=UPI00055DE3C0|nr:acyltransferase [Microbispora rosea]
MSAPLRRVAERTPPGRDRHIDLLRAVAIVLVVLGHWLAVVVTYRGRIGGDTVLAFVPWARPLTWLFQVMPVFFLVGGFAGAASLGSYRRRGGDAIGWFLCRTDRLIRPTTAFLLALGGAALIALLLGADPATVGMGVWLACLPLWFLIAYVTVVLLTPVLLALHRRAGLAVPAVFAVAVAFGDAARLLGGPGVIGAANYLLAWAAVYQLGIAWREGALSARPRVAVPMIVGGLGALVLLTVPGPYPVSMVTDPGARLQNTSPPTLALLALAVAQTGVALLLHERGGRMLRRTRPWTVVVAANSVIMTVFLWHMTAVVIAVLALYVTGLLPQPPPGSAAWLLLRVPWLAFLTATLAVLVAVFARFERRAFKRRAFERRAFERRGGPRPASGPGRAGASTFAATVTGAGLVVAGLLGTALTGAEGLSAPRLPVHFAVFFAVYFAGAALLWAARSWHRRVTS